MSLFLPDLQWADSVVSTNLLLIRQGGDAGEDRKVQLDSIKNYILSDISQLNINAPQVEIQGNLNITENLTVNGVDIIEYVSQDHNHDDRYFTQDYITAALATKAPLIHNHDDLYYPRAEIYNKQEVDDEIDDVKNYLINNLPPHTHDDRYYLKSETEDLISEVDLRSGGIINGNVSINGDLSILGTTTTINTQTIELTDNIIEINSNQTGTPDASLQSGLQINRGTETDYQLIFEELSLSFKAGPLGSLQTIAMREESPLDDGYAKWDNTNKQFITESFQDLIAMIKEEIFPIGSIYTQLPGKKSPDELNYPGTWEIISGSGKEFDGIFFRAEGTYATSFGSDMQYDTVKKHTHTTYIGSHNHAIQATDSLGGIDGPTGDKYAILNDSDYNTILSTDYINNPIVSYDYGSKTSGYQSPEGDDYETRPRNKTIRIWERIS